MQTSSRKAARVSGRVRESLASCSSPVVSIYGEMSEWLKEHAWTLTPAARADPHEIPPTHVGSVSSRYTDLLRDAPASDDVHRCRSRPVLPEPRGLIRARLPISRWRERP